MKRYDVIITAKNFKSVIYSANLNQDQLKAEIEREVPESNVDYQRIFTDKRCKSFKHLMPINKTIAKNNYKGLHDLMSGGSNTRIYITEISNK